MKRPVRISVSLAALSAALIGSQLMAAGPPGDPILPLLKVSGAVTLVNCQAEKTQVRIRVGTKTVTAATRVLNADGSVRLTYSAVFPDDELAGTEVRVVPSLTPGVCSGGTWSPSSRQARIPSTGANFTYNVAAGATYRIGADGVAAAVDSFLRTAELRLHNNREQGSFVQISGIRFEFSIPVIRIDLDCGTFCPDAGDGLFYVNDLNLRDADFRYGSSAFTLALAFEDAGREIKGYHNKLGDDLMTDVEMNNMRVSLKAQPKVNADGELSLGFYQPDLKADISTTGACKPFGIDVCNFLFGTDKKVEKGIETGALSALNGAQAQTGLKLGIRQYLRSRGITQAVIGARFEGNDIIILTR